MSRAPNLAALAVCAVLAICFAGPLAAQDRALDQHAQAVEAYRDADWESARTLWLAALEGSADDTEVNRAALCYNLGNVAYRLEKNPEAVAWYTSALTLAPRFPEARENLELARRAAGLDPADRGDLDAALHAVLTALTPSESEWLALAALALTAFAFAYEALRGGAAGRRFVGVALALLVVALLPWLYGLARAKRDPWMVVSGAGVELRAEPRDAATVTGEIEVATTVDRVDAWAGWIKVEAADGKQGWIVDDEAQPLRP